MRVVMKNRFELVHVGINTESPEKALQLAELLSAMFHLQLRHGKKSEFAGDYFECMKAPFLLQTERCLCNVFILPCRRMIWPPPWRS